VRAVVTFVRESVRFRRGDGHWLVVLPRSAVAGRFPRHEAHFDPGQRVANIIFVLLLPSRLRRRDGTPVE
jgi:hypothetical protein